MKSVKTIQEYKELLQNKALISLQLPRNLSQTHLKEIIAALDKDNCCLEKIDFSHISFDTTSLRELIKVLAKLKSLKELIFSSNKLTTSDLSYFTFLLNNNESIEVLKLSHNQFGYCTKSSIQFYNFAKALSKHNKLIELDLSYNKMPSFQLLPIIERLQEKAALHSLNLSGNKIDSSGMYELAKLLRISKSLTKLSLAYNSDPLSAKPSNPHKSLAGGYFLPILDALKSNALSLRELDLKGNDLGEKDLSLLKTVLKINKNLSCIVSDKDLVKNTNPSSQPEGPKNQSEQILNDSKYATENDSRYATDEFTSYLKPHLH